MKKRSVCRPRNSKAMKKTIRYIKKHPDCKISDIGKEIALLTDDRRWIHEPKRYWDIGNRYVKYLENDNLVQVSAVHKNWYKHSVYSVKWIGD